MPFSEANTVSIGKKIGAFGLLKDHLCHELGRSVETS